jgi:hypothetical protein
MGEVRDHVRVVLAQRPGGGVVAIALLGHRQADDAHGRIAHSLEQRLGIGGRDEELAHGAHDPEPLAGAGPDRQGVEPVLGAERVAGVGGTQARAADRPVGLAGREAVVEIDRLVRPVEGPDAEMDDADPRRRAVVGGALDRRRQGLEGRGREPGHRPGSCLARATIWVGLTKRSAMTSHTSVVTM